MASRKALMPRENPYSNAPTSGKSRKIEGKAKETIISAARANGRSGTASEACS